MNKIYNICMNLQSIHRLLTTTVAEILIFALLFFLAYRVYDINKKEIGPRRDIAVEFATGIELKDGINPYTKVKEFGYDLLRNRKYNEKLPTYYFFLLGIAATANYDFDTYINIFRWVTYLSAFAAAYFTFLTFKKQSHLLLGYTAAAFLLFNRWTLLNLRDVKSDMIAIAFLIASMYFLSKKPKLAYLLYGLSLGIKHVGIFAFPIYLMPLINREIKFKKFVEYFSYTLVPTLLPSLVFLIQDAKSFILSVMFSVTRAPSSTNSSVPFGYDQILVKFNPTGIGFLTPFFYMLPRLPLILFATLFFYLYVTKKLKGSFFVFGCFLFFATFNPVVLDQYFTWVAAFMMYSVVDYLPSNKKTLPIT